MLSELHQLARNLRIQGIDVEASHKDFGAPGLSGRASLRVRLTDNGIPVEVTSASPSDIPALWTLKKYNFDFFPAVRVDRPVFDVPLDDPFWAPKLTRQSVLDAINRHRPKARAIEIAAGVADQAGRIRRWAGAGTDDTMTSLVHFAAAFLAFSKIDKTSLKLVEAVEAGVATADPEFLKAAAAVLFGRRLAPRGKPPKIECKAQLLFDLKSRSDPFFSIYTATMRHQVRHALSMESSSADGKTSAAPPGICALELSPRELLSGPMPQWRASKVITKDVVPFSKFSDAKCHYRYGHADSESFPLGRDTAETLVGALKWVTDDARLNATWRPIRNGKLIRRQGRTYEDQDLLIAYPSADAETLALVRLFAAASQEDGVEPASNEKSFADTAEAVLSALREKVQTGRIAQWVRLILIRSVSKGQIQLAHMSSPSIEELASAVEAWRRSEDNLPRALRIPVRWTKAKNGIGWFRPRVLFPEEIGRLLTHQWIRAGTECSRVESPPIGVVFDLFLRKPGVWQQHAAQLLEVTLARCAPLLTGAGRLLHLKPSDVGEKWLSEWLDLFPLTASGKPDFSKPQPGRSFVNSISLIGSLLYAMNSTVDQYTNESAFLLGRLLAMMDELHRCYCVAERGGDIPNSLIGNGLLGRAAESPARAIEELLDRSRIYLGWAKTAEPPSDPKKESARIAVFSARKVLRLAAPLSESLHRENALDEELTPVRKAHLFLGYLSPVLGDRAGTDTGSGAHPQDDTQPNGAK